ncbi:MAG: InlB B-repeat-containing protein [Solirubrobacteraceae bacterium]
MAQLFDVVRARLQAEPRRAHSSIRLKPLLAAASAGVLFLKAPPPAEAAPVNTSPPAISGVLEPDNTLTATLGTWQDAKSPIVSYDYQWLRCIQYECTDIDYQTNSTFTLPWELVGAQAEVTVVATDAEGEVGIATSEQTDVIGYGGPRYTVSETVSGSGSVTGTANGTADSLLACPGACGASYPYRPGTSIQVTATPAPGAAFLGWQGACAGSSPTCSLALGENEAVTAVFTGTATTTPVLPTGSEPRAGEAPVTGAPSGSTPAATSLRARLQGLRALRHHIQASVECVQAKPCRLSLGLFARTVAGQLMIAQRSFTVAAGRSARIVLTLSRQGQRLLARRHRLPVTARLTLSASGRSALVGQGHLTLAS